MSRKPSPRVVTLFSTSETHVEGTRKTFETARTTLMNARTYGNANHVTAAKQAFLEAAEIYAEALRTHASIVTDYTAEVAS